ncbi:MAG: hypothetical protein RL199_2071 [Pseudomonadota bacterium]|jgi:hypothetical protein
MSWWRLWTSSFQPHAYRALLQEPRAGMGFLWRWVALATFASAVLTVGLVVATVPSIRRAVAAGPDFGVRDGRFFYDGPQPVRRQLGAVAVVVDTTGELRRDEERQPVGILISDDRLTVREGGEVRELKLADLGVRTFTRPDLDRVLAWSPWVLLAFHLPLALWWMFVAFVLVVLVSPLAASASAGALNRAQSLKLTAHAFVVPMTIGMSPLSFPGMWLLIGATGAVLTWLGARPVENTPARRSAS